MSILSLDSNPTKVFGSSDSGNDNLELSDTKDSKILNDTDFQFKSIEELRKYIPEYTPLEFKENLPGNNGFHLFEEWTKFNNIPARILGYTEEIVTCECLMDNELQIFEDRVFPKLLFDHLQLKLGGYVLVSIKSKIGSCRIDVYKGELYFDIDLFDKTAFSLKDKWEAIENSDLDSPFEYIP